MTAYEKVSIEHPEQLEHTKFGGVRGCPDDYGYLPPLDECDDGVNSCDELCTKCWNREIPEKVIDALCEVGNPNPISPEELKAARGLYEIKTRAFNPDDYNYESPITVTMQQIMYNIMQEQEKYILKQIHNCGVTVNKEELTKALAYDRDQYNKGFEDGREWVSAKIYAAYKALLDGFTDEAIGYLGELLDDHKEGAEYEHADT